MSAFQTPIKMTIFDTSFQPMNAITTLMNRNMNIIIAAGIVTSFTYATGFPLIPFLSTMALVGLAFLIAGFIVGHAVKILSPPIIKGNGPHLVVICHGVGACNTQAKNMIDEIIAQDPNWKSKYTFMAFSTYPAILGFLHSVYDHALLLKSEIEKAFTVHELRIERMSFIGISLGGLVGAHARALLKTPLETKGIEGESLITIGTPWTGILPDKECYQDYTTFELFVLQFRHYISTFLPISYGLKHFSHIRTPNNHHFKRIIKYTCSGKDVTVPNDSALAFPEWKGRTAVLNPAWLDITTRKNEKIECASFQDDRIGITKVYNESLKGEDELFKINLDIHPLFNHSLLCQDPHVFEHIARRFFLKNPTETKQHEEFGEQ